MKKHKLPEFLKVQKAFGEGMTKAQEQSGKFPHVVLASSGFMGENGSNHLCTGHSVWGALTELSGILGEMSD